MRYDDQNKRTIGAIIGACTVIIVILFAILMIVGLARLILIVLGLA